MALDGFTPKQRLATAARCPLVSPTRNVEITIDYASDYTLRPLLRWIVRLCCPIYRFITEVFVPPTRDPSTKAALDANAQERLTVKMVYINEVVLTKTMVQQLRDRKMPAAQILRSE